MAGRPDPPPAWSRTPGRDGRLIGRLRSSTDGVVVVSGPAGAGKSMLVDGWARGERHVRVVRVAPRHNSADTLRHDVLAAVGAAPGPADPDADWWPERLARVLAAGPYTADRPCRLVLDGADTIADPEAQLVLQDLVERRPALLRLLVTTRHRSPSWIARGRACGLATTITADELRLQPADVRALVGHDLPELDGWALGVGLVAELGRRGAGPTIRDYLRSEVMGRVTTEVRHLLYAVSVAGATSPALAIHLTGNAAAGRLLAQFADTSQFATVADGPVFTLHPVLSAHLRDELAVEHWESSVALRRRHAEWLATHGRLDLSTRCYVELGDGGTARRSLLAHWQRCVLSGRPEVVHDALDTLPPDQLAPDPRTCVVAAMARIAAGDHRGWRRWIDVAAAAETTELEPGLPVGVAVAASRRLAEAVTSGTVTSGTVTSGTVPDRGAEPPLHGLWMAISEVADGLALMWSGDGVAATARFRRAEVASRISGDQLALVHALAGLALTAARDGAPDTVLLADEAIAVADRLSPQCRWVVVNAHLALATAHLSAGAAQSARAAARTVLEVLEAFPDELEQRSRAAARDVLAALDRTAARREQRARDLSSREQRVLRALCGPLTLREIADELFVSHNTVKSQVRSIFRKLGVHDRAAAVAAARSWSTRER